MGGWRDRYRALSSQAPAVEGFGHNGLLYAFSWGPPTNSSGQLPDGRSFADVRELKSLLLTNPELIARNLIHQLTTYATGAPVQFADRPVVDNILAKSRKKAFGIRTLIHELVQSDVFRMK